MQLFATACHRSCKVHMGSKTARLCHGRKICIGLWNTIKSWLRKHMLWAQSGTSRVLWFSFILGHWILQNNLGFLSCRANTATLGWNGEFGLQSSALWWCAAWNRAESSWEIKLKAGGGISRRVWITRNAWGVGAEEERASLWIVSCCSQSVCSDQPRLWERCSCASCVCS